VAKGHLRAPQVSDHDKNQIGYALNQRLPHNWEPGQLHGNRKADFSVHDDSGDRVLFVENVSERGASNHTSDRAMNRIFDAIDRTREMTSAKQLHIVTKDGWRSFSTAQRTEIKQRAGNDVKVDVWDRTGPANQRMLNHIVKQVQQASARHNASRGYQVGAHGENEIRAALNQRFPHNWEPEQLHGNRKPDFSVHDDSGDRVLFVESKARWIPQKGAPNRASEHDIGQTLDVIDRTREMTSAKELHIAAEGGKRFFSTEQWMDIIERAGGDVKVFVWDRTPAAIQRMVDHIEKRVQQASADQHASNQQAAKSAVTQSQSAATSHPAAKPSTSTTKLIADRLRVNSPQSTAESKQTANPSVSATNPTAGQLRVNSQPSAMKPNQKTRPSGPTEKPTAVQLRVNAVERAAKPAPPASSGSRLTVGPRPGNGQGGPSRIAPPTTGKSGPGVSATPSGSLVVSPAPTPTSTGGSQPGVVPAPQSGPGTGMGHS
jgi:hypothetical protein